MFVSRKAGLKKRLALNLSPCSAANMLSLLEMEEAKIKPLK